jgi:hypothetical protein
MELVNSKHILGVIVGVTLVTALGVIQSAEAVDTRTTGNRQAPPAISGENVYVAWWTNATANNNEEISSGHLRMAALALLTRLT